MPQHKITFIHPDLGIGGAERLVLDVAITLSQKKNKVQFVTNHFDKNHAFEELKSSEFPIRVIGDWIPRSICGIFQALCAYFRMIYLSLCYVIFTKSEDKPDVYFIDQIPMAVPFIKWNGGKVIYYCHHPDLLASAPGGILKRIYRCPINWLEMKGTTMADVILVNSKYTASVFHKTFPQVKKEIKILYPTISALHLNLIKSTARKPMSEILNDDLLSQSEVFFLSINRFHPAKKLELAIDALESLQNKLSRIEWKRVHLIMAGGYDPQSTINAVYFKKLTDLTTKKRLNTKITFLKSMSDSTKAELLIACDCLVYTPINEHFGIVPLEAMAASKPVIACNSGGPCETVEHGVTGYLCDPTADSLAESMEKILDKKNSIKMGILGKERLEKHFSDATFTDRLLKIVSKVCEPVKRQENETRAKSGSITTIDECSEDSNNSSKEEQQNLPTVSQKGDEPRAKSGSITTIDESFEDLNNSSREEQQNLPTISQKGDEPSTAADSLKSSQGGSNSKVESD